MAVATLTAAALTLSACGRDSGGAGGSTESAKDISSGPATGTLTVWAMGAEGDKLPDLMKDFEAANPGVKVNVTAIPVGLGPRQVHDGDHGRDHARRRDDRQHLDG
jgi:multiple sugar transport system substrate-binding protein